jgi:hypothetical protein
MRTARCQCGALRVETRGEPGKVLVCHCTGCQRRTGSAFGLSAYYRTENVAVHGASSTWERAGESGKSFITHFCPSCGTSVYWYLGALPGLIGIAVGTFADRNFPAPTDSVWEERGHAWARVEAAFRHPGQPIG